MKTFAEAFPKTPKPHTFGVVTRPSLIWTMNRFLHLVQALGFNGCNFVGPVSENGRSWEGVLEISGRKVWASVGNGWVYLVLHQQVEFFPVGKRWKKLGSHSVKKQMEALKRILAVKNPEPPPQNPIPTDPPQKTFPLPEGTLVYTKDGVLIGKVTRATETRAIVSFKL